MYVDNNRGDDNNPGTYELPLRTINKALELKAEIIMLIAPINPNDWKYCYGNDQDVKEIN